MELRRGRIRGRVHPGRGRGTEPGPVGPEPARQRLEEGDARTGFQLAIAGKNFARERDAALGERAAAELKERWRALKHVSLSPSRIGDIARAALVLNGTWK